MIKVISLDNIVCMFLYFITNVVHDCGIPSREPNTIVTFNRTTLGSIATFSCAVGYNPTTSNDDIMICDDNGEWSGESLQCSKLL